MGSTQGCSYGPISGSKLLPNMKSMDKDTSRNERYTLEICFVYGKKHKASRQAYLTTLDKRISYKLKQGNYESHGEYSIYGFA